MTKATIKVNGTIYDGWKSTTVRRSIEAISSVFSFDFTDSWTPNRKPWGVNPQDSVDIEIAGTRLIRGYVEVLNARLGSERSYTVQGRDRTCDVIDCSAAIKQYSNITLLALCNALASIVDVEFTLASPLVNNKVFTSWTVEPGETIFASIDRACRLRGVLCIPDGSGNVTLTNAGLLPALTPLVEGVNCKTLSYTLDTSKRFSDYTVKGQDTGLQGWTGPATSVQGTARDAGVKRVRPLIIVAENRATAAEAQIRASWEANVRAARGTGVVVEVTDWVQAPGVPWLINQTVSMQAPKLGFGGNFLIAETEYTQDDRGGTSCKLTLAPPDAYATDQNVKKKQTDQVARGWTL